MCVKKIHRQCMNVYANMKINVYKARVVERGTTVRGNLKPKG